MQTAPREQTFRSRARASLRQNVRAYRARLRRCHELAMAEDYRVGGRVHLRLQVGAAGVVLGARVVKNHTGSALLGRCVARVSERFVFPSSEATHSVDLALRFAAPKEKYTVRMDDVPARPLGSRKVAAKRLLTRRNVTRPEVALTVLRLAPGASFLVPPGQRPVGLHVLTGALTIAGAQPARHPGAPPRAVRVRDIVLRAGHGAALERTSSRVRLTNRETRHTAFLLFSDSRWEPRLRGAPRAPAPGRPSAAPPGRRPAPGPAPLFVRAPGGPPDAVLRTGHGRLPMPAAVAISPGQRALLNPDRAPVALALLVTEGALVLTLRGVRLLAEAGMAVYVPKGASAVAAPAVRETARLVVMPWPPAGQWQRAPEARLLRFERAPLPPPMRRPGGGPGTLSRP